MTTTMGMDTITRIRSHRGDSLCGIIMAVGIITGMAMETITEIRWINITEHIQIAIVTIHHIINTTEMAMDHITDIMVMDTVTVDMINDNGGMVEIVMADTDITMDTN